MTRRIALNAAALAGLKIAAPLLSLAIVLAVSRRLGAEGLGRYSLAYTYVTLFGLLGPLGLPALLTREGARDRAAMGRLLSGSLALGGVFSGVLTLAMSAASRCFGYDPETVRSLAILSLTLAPAAWLSYCDAAFLALERTGPMAATSVVEHAFKVGLGIALLWAGWGLEAALAAAVLGKIVACGVAVVWLRRLGIGVTSKVEFAMLRKLTAQAPVFALSAVCATLYWRADVFLLSWLRDVREVGYYTAAYRLLDIAVLLPQSLCHALYPRLAAARAGDARIHWWLFLLTAPAAAGTTLLAGPLLGFLYGPGFAAAAPALAILVWTAVPYAWNRYHAYLLVANDRQHVDLAINAALLAVNLGLNLVLIPRFGARGAALVTLATALLYGVTQLICLGRRGTAPAPA